MKTRLTPRSASPCAAPLPASPPFGGEERTGLSRKARILLPPESGGGRAGGHAKRGSLLASLALFLAVSSSGRAGADPASLAGSSFAHAQRAANAIASLDFGLARSEILQGDHDDPAIAKEEGRLAAYEGRCDDALVSLGRPDVLSTESGAFLFDIARGCARVTAATVVDTDETHSVVIRYQDENDRALTPLIVETVVAARDAITRDLGVSWPKPTRITVVRDLMSLSAMTGLPLKSAQTTGTVAVAKWGRVTLLSPRASEHGYAWRDTVAHELTHLSITHASAENAPLWLQEGMAKREEVRWRPPGPFDGRPSPDDIAARGFELKLALPLDQLGPSIAMLPSADAALVAFAEVTSFVRYLAATDPDVLRRLLASLRRKGDVDAALLESSGADLHTWDTRWRAYLANETHAPLPPSIGLGGASSDVHELRDRVRLAELLYGRSHPGPALTELERVKASGKDDPSVESLRAHVLGALGRKAEGELEVKDPKGVGSSYGPWWAIRGRWEREDGQVDDADSSFVEAVATDPFDVESACEMDDSAAALQDDSGPETAARALCEAAKARHDPPLGTD
jgi:hypothetical protein